MDSADADGLRLGHIDFECPDLAILCYIEDGKYDVCNISQLRNSF